MNSDELHHVIAKIPADEMLKFVRKAQKRMTVFKGFDIKAKNDQKFRQRLAEEYGKGTPMAVAFVNRYIQEREDGGDENGEEAPSIAEEPDLGQTTLSDLASEIASSRQQLLRLMHEVSEHIMNQDRTIQRLEQELDRAHQELARMTKQDGEQTHERAAFYCEVINEFSALHRSIALIQHQTSAASGEISVR